MKAIALICSKSMVFSLESVQLPEPAPGEVVVRTAFSGISIGTELALIQNKISWGPYPLCTGYMATGVVEALGADVSGVAVGDKVFVRGNRGIALEDGTAVSPTSGTHCSHLVTRMDGTHGAGILPENVSMETASLFVMPAVGFNGVDMAQPKAGESVVGFQNPEFRPLQIPIPDEHPCLDRDGYGLSKYLMEEVARYYVRQNSGIDVVALRFAALAPDEAMPPKVAVGPSYPWAVGSITMMRRSDAVRALRLAVESQLKPGLRIMNAVPRKAWIAGPVAEVLRNWWRDDVDLSYFNASGREHASIFASDRIDEELGFVAD
jgi:UDP-glucose 4-epimerase